MKRLFVVLLCFWGLAGIADAKPVSEDQFSARFVTMLKSALPGVSIEVTGPMDLIVKPAKGGEYQVYLGNAYLQYQNDPERLEEILKVYVSQTKAIAARAAEDNKLDRTRIVPIIKDRAWLEEISRNLKAKTGDGKLENIYEDFNEDLVIVYAEDTGQSLSYFTQKQLDAAGIQRSGLRALAVANLKRIVPKYEIGRLQAVSRIKADEGYDACLLLFGELWAGLEAKSGDIVVAIPARDVLLFTPASDRQGVAKIGDYAEKIARDSAYALTGRLFLYRNGRFERLN
jgi:uncharacterized protein YtpQ (UPF0354 family)